MYSFCQFLLYLNCLIASGRGIAKEFPKNLRIIITIIFMLRGKSRGIVTLEI